MKTTIKFTEQTDKKTLLAIKKAMKKPFEPLHLGVEIADFLGCNVEDIEIAQPENTAKENYETTVSLTSIAQFYRI